VHRAENPELGTLEQDLRLALGWEPSPGAAAHMDRAVAAAIAHAPTALGGVRRWGLPKLALAVLLTLLLLGAASALTLLQQAAELMPGWRVAYERAEHLNLSQPVGDYTVTLERGYVDPNQLVLAFLVDGPDRTFYAVPRGEVVDSEGRSYLEIAGGDIGAELENSAATISSYQVPPSVGATVDLTATIPELVPVTEEDVAAPLGPWVFHFSLPVHPATIVQPNATVTAAHVPITLQRVQITETADRILLGLELSAIRDKQWTRWQMIGTLQQARGPSQELMWAPLPPEWTGQPKADIEDLIARSEFGDIQVRQTFAGTDSPAGRWTLTISRLSGADGSGDVRFVDGPWVFHFVVP
jgi:hypothetical protein